MEVDWTAILIWGISPLIGAIIGGILTWWTTHTVEEKKGRREDARRFETVRRLAYVKLLRTVDQFLFLKSTQKKVPSNLDTEFKDALAEIEIIATPETREYALSLGRIITEQILNREGLPLLTDAIETSRKNFVESIQRELNISVLNQTAKGAETTKETGFEATSKESSSRSNSSTPNTIPLPIVTGGIGLLLAFATAGGLTGGQGFLIGFVTGLILLVLIAILETARAKKHNS